MSRYLFIIFSHYNRRGSLLSEMTFSHHSLIFQKDDIISWSRAIDQPLTYVCCTILDHIIVRYILGHLKT